MEPMFCVSASKFPGLAEPQERLMSAGQTKQSADAESVYVFKYISRLLG